MRAPPKASPAPAVDDVDRERRHLDALVAGRGEHTFGPLLDDCELDPTVEQRVRRPVRFGLAHRDLALLAVADRDGDVPEARPTCSLASSWLCQNIGR